MITLSWNCRGLARAMATAKRTLRALIRDIGLDIIFLSKIKIPNSKISDLLKLLGFYNIECVDPRGKKGGLEFGWKIGVDMEITFKSSNIINGLIFSDPINEP